MASVNSTTTSANRLTGLATGLDIDSMVKAELKAYQTKIDTTKQQKDVTELRQKLYRDLVSDIRDFNDKYLDPLSSDSLLMSKNFVNVSFESSDSSVVTATAISGANVDNYNVVVNQLAKRAEVTITDDDLRAADKITISYLGHDYDIDIPSISDTTSMSNVVDNINEQFKNLNISGLKVEYSQFSGGLKIESSDMGEKIGDVDNKVSVKAFTKNGDNYDPMQLTSLIYDDASNSFVTSRVDSLEGKGQNAIAKIQNSRGEVYNYDDSSNKLVVDGVQFVFNRESNIVTSGLDSYYDVTRVTGKVDATNAKDKIVKFIDDYNTLIEKLNKAINTKHDRSYQPLTSDQKDAMSDKEVELWNKKVEEGQLYKDTDLTRITNALKESMRSVMSGTGLSLEAIGIEPVKDYTGSKNGTFKINETKLTSALENDIEGVMKLFTANPITTSSDDTSASKKGIIVQLKSILQDELSSDSSLAKKIGYEGTSTFSNNTLTKNISDYEKKISAMNKDLARREQLLYSKYANLETIMNQYNSQQSYLMSYLGG